MPQKERVKRSQINPESRRKSLSSVKDILNLQHKNTKTWHDIKHF